MGPLPAEERHISNLCFRLVVDLVRHHGGEAAVEELVRRSGDPRPLDVLADDAQWSSYTQFRQFLVAGAICRTCEVVDTCREYARRNREQGYWGGENDEQRVAARRRMNRRPATWAAS